MKRIIAAVAFAVLAVPAFAFAADASARADEPTASAGPTNAGSSGWATGVWADDPGFIAPAQ